MELDEGYFGGYGRLAVQESMLADTVRTAAYHRAFLAQRAEIEGHRVMDLGSGTGLLAFFALQVGAAEVLAVEASPMAKVLRALAQGQAAAPGDGRPGSRLRIIQEVAEQISEEQVPRGSVDVLVSEPLGNCLLNERMLESFLYCRDRFLKPGGLMIPHTADLVATPFGDPLLHAEVDLGSSAGLWGCPHFFGVDLRPALPFVKEERYLQAVVDYVDPCCLRWPAATTRRTFDFRKLQPEELQHVVLELGTESGSSDGPTSSDGFSCAGASNTSVKEITMLHGICCWFEAALGPSGGVLSTAPGAAGTHWYQTRFLVRSPLQVAPGAHVKGSLEFIAHQRRSYFVQLEVSASDSDIKAVGSLIDLRDAWYRAHSSISAYRPPDVLARVVLSQTGPVGCTIYAVVAYLVILVCMAGMPRYP